MHLFKQTLGGITLELKYKGDSILGMYEYRITVGEQELNLDPVQAAALLVLFVDAAKAARGFVARFIKGIRNVN